MGNSCFKLQRNLIGDDWIISKNPKAAILVRPQKALEPETRRLSGFPGVSYLYISISGCLFLSLLFILLFFSFPNSISSLYELSFLLLSVCLLHFSIFVIRLSLLGHSCTKLDALTWLYFIHHQFKQIIHHE